MLNHAGQMYGEFDPNTREWQDGIMSTMYRHAAASTTSDRKWVMFDGPVEHDPFTIRRSTSGGMPIHGRHDAVLPLPGVRVELAVHLACVVQHQR